MKDKRKVIVLVTAIVAIAAIGIGATTSTVAAQSSNNSTTTSDDVVDQGEDVVEQDDPTSTETETGDDAVEVAETLGDLVVHSYHVDNGTMKIRMTWEGRAPTTVTLTEMLPMDQSGTAQISFKTVRITPDETIVVDVDVSTSTDVDAVMLSTTESVERGDALLLREQGSGSDVEYQVWWVALAVGVVGAILSFAIIKKWRDWRASESIWRVPIDG